MLLGTEQLSMLYTRNYKHSGAVCLALRLVHQEFWGSMPLKRSFMALCRHCNVQANLETMLPQLSSGAEYFLWLSCTLQLLAAFAVQLPGQDTPLLPAAEAYGDAAVAYSDAAIFDKVAVREACTAGSADTKCCHAYAADVLQPLPQICRGFRLICLQPIRIAVQDRHLQALANAASIPPKSERHHALQLLEDIFGLPYTHPSMQMTAAAI